MRKVILAIIGLFMFIPGVYAAGSVTASSTSVTLYPGETKTIKVTANNAAGRVDFSVNNSNISAINLSSEFLDNSSADLVVTAVSLGSTRIRVSLTDVTTYDDEKLSGTININVNVVERTTQATQAPTTAAPTTTKPITQPVITETTTTESTTTTELQLAFTTITVGDYPVKFENNTYYVDVAADVEEVEVGGTVADGLTVEGFGTRTLAIGKNQVDLKIKSVDGRELNYVLIINRPDPNNVKSTKLVNLKIVGYPISFNPNVKDYTITVPKNVDAIYIDAKAENPAVKIQGAGEVTLKGNKNIIKVNVSYGELNSTTYTIVVKKSSMAFVYVLMGGLSIGLITCIVLLIKKKNDNKENTIEEANAAIAETVQTKREEDENATVTVGGEEVLGVGRKTVEPTVIGKEEMPDEYVDKTENYVPNSGEIDLTKNIVKPISVEDESITIENNKVDSISLDELTASVLKDNVVNEENLKDSSDNQINVKRPAVSDVIPTPAKYKKEEKANN